ncbi:hypothetical protein [Kibdelosporangium phytohabitans]|uniref:Uncharacterized protein n=1 Tax=Kibdelosporangium phytohabitans TaxID=860235 RepID=A0A0N9I092_9PSEU|nr:hypothetical protein [Kibdelosporangium phytohabitans]ALG07867.1 hypothetical protein AOZ06_13930 [Kibdelosporangium phytohabitans]MBE1471206.1 hypothetical protein [Kibdelosporangium phytohabitans]
MDMTASMAGSAAAAKSAPRGLIPASVVLGGTMLSLVGLTWDIQWHSDVGPDTFFTLPHLLLYSGSAVAGIASLVVVLMTTAAQRRGGNIDPIVGGRAVGVFGKTFAAPVGYLVSGVGAASFLLYGLWDQWWHSLYGFDAVIDSPPHIGLLLSISITMVGAVMVFATAREHRWGQAGTIAGAATLLAFSMVTVIGLRALPDGIVYPVTAGATFMCVLLLTMAAGVITRRGGALAVAVAVGLIQAVFWWFSPWAARVYADAVGLPVRDYIDGVPSLPALIPMSLIIVAAAIELLRKVPAAITGAVGGLIITLTVPLQNAWVYGGSMPPTDAYLATAAVGAIVGALAGMLGRRFGQMLRHLAPANETSPEEASHA